jgi:polysaccharide pyruvyl transferase WcaK-like protein
VPFGLINAYSTLNLGDAAIYSAFRKLLPLTELVACVQDDHPDPTLGVTFLSERPRHCEAYISVGGDIFNNSREWFVTKAFLQNLAELRHSPLQTFLFGQSIPRSCHGLSFMLLRQCLLKLAAVCVRDAESHRRLRQAGVSARLSYDIAFVLESSEAARQQALQMLQAQAIDPARAAMLSVRGFDSMYGHDNGRFVERMTELCRGLLQQGHTPVVLIQARAYGADNVDVVIAVRFHTAVLALASGRVPYHLHYSNKGRDLCRRLELPGTDLGSFDPVADLPAILASRARSFDHGRLRDQVRSDFNWCLSRLPLSARSALH